ALTVRMNGLVEAPSITNILIDSSSKALVTKEYFQANLPTGGVTVAQMNAALALKLDVAAYNDRFKGKYTSFLNLQTSLPVGVPGEYAQVDEGTGSPVVNYNWDDEEGWVIGSPGSQATDTDMLPE